MERRNQEMGVKTLRRIGEGKGAIERTSRVGEGQGGSPTCQSSRPACLPSPDWFVAMACPVAECSPCPAWLSSLGRFFAPIHQWPEPSAGRCAHSPLRSRYGAGNEHWKDTVEENQGRWYPPATFLRVIALRVLVPSPTHTPQLYV